MTFKAAPSVIVARVFVCLLSGVAVLFGGFLSLAMTSFHSDDCRLDNAACHAWPWAAGYWAAALPLAAAMICGITAATTALSTRRAVIAWPIALGLAVIALVLPVMVARWL